MAVSANGESNISANARSYNDFASSSEACVRHIVSVAPFKALSAEGVGQEDLSVRANGKGGVGASARSGKQLAGGGKGRTGHCSLGNATGDYRFIISSLGGIGRGCLSRRGRSYRIVQLNSACLRCGGSVNAYHWVLRIEVINLDRGSASDRGDIARGIRNPFQTSCTSTVGNEDLTIAANRKCRRCSSSSTGYNSAFAGNSRTRDSCCTNVIGSLDCGSRRNQVAVSGGNAIGNLILERVRSNCFGVRSAGVGDSSVGKLDDTCGGVSGRLRASAHAQILPRGTIRKEPVARLGGVRTATTRRVVRTGNRNQNVIVSVASSSSGQSRTGNKTGTGALGSYGIQETRCGVDGTRQSNVGCQRNGINLILQILAGASGQCKSEGCACKGIVKLHHTLVACCRVQNADYTSSNLNVGADLDHTLLRSRSVLDSRNREDLASCKSNGAGHCTASVRQRSLRQQIGRLNGG